LLLPAATCGRISLSRTWYIERDTHLRDRRHARRGAPKTYCYRSTVCDMVTPTKRRQRGNSKGSKPVFGIIDDHAGAIFQELVAATSETAKWSVAEVTFSYVGTQLDKRGLPPWWRENVQKRRIKGEISRTRDADDSSDDASKHDRMDDDHSVGGEIATGYGPFWVTVSPEAYAVITRIHEASGVAKGIIVEEILHWVGTQLTDNGLPAWWPSVPLTLQEAYEIPA
jgi:hypothetical protein